MAVGFARDLKLLNAPDERFSHAAAKECETCQNTFQHTSHMIHLELHLKGLSQNWFITVGFYSVEVPLFSLFTVF